MKYFIGQVLYPKKDYLGLEENKPVEVIAVNKNGRHTKVDVEYKGNIFKNISVKKFRLKAK